MLIARQWIAVLLSVCVIAWLVMKPAEAADADFTRDVKPILAEHCIQCHGPDKAEGGLDLSESDKALVELDSGQRAIVPGQANASQLIARITSTDPDERMPPGDEKPLKPSDIEVLRKWIDAGAEFQVHWSFQALRKPDLPIVKDAGWVKNPIDAFVLANLESHQVKPSPEARPHQLVRRLYLDLLGLLPDSDQVDAFVKSYQSSHGETSQGNSLESEQVYEKLVDDLLASPHFGERWGRHWLDLARYADSDGYEKDRPRPDAYAYRDWVIQAFNDNMPFDQFTIEQLAGDLLPDATPKQRIATAFNRQTLTNTEGGVDQEEYRVAAVFDRTDTLGSVWLGLTVGCAKCHTHKYDPIPHTDYYRLFAFFNEADERVESLPVKVDDEAGLRQAVSPLLRALRERYREIADDQQRWEIEQRKIIESGSNTPLAVDTSKLEVSAISSQGLTLNQQEDGSLLVSMPQSAKETPLSEFPATDTFHVTVGGLPERLTGLRLESIPHASFGKGGAGLSGGGNFVITRLSAEIVDEQDHVVRGLELQKATADFEQTGFKAVDAIGGKANSKKGWAISPKVDKPHWLQVRTLSPLTLEEGQRLRLIIEQSYGGKHVLGRFRVRAVTGDELELGFPKEIVNSLKMYPEKRTNETRDSLFDFYAKQDSQVQQLRGQIDAIYKKFKAQVMPVRLIAESRQDRDTFRFDRGDFLSPAEKVEPGTLSALPGLVPQGERPTRLDLAKWIVGPDNTLAPRVIANQLWSRIFGAGLVRSIGDFGVRGETPSHPELLDWLAATYRDDLKWNTKAFLKTIFMSATYRQSSTHRPELVDVDPLNQWLSRQNRLRVEGELVRDLTLQVAGLLSPKIGGPSVFPPMPPELAKLSYANNFSWADSKGEDRYRRGMYTFFKRTIPHPTLMTFDCPDANLTCVNRSVSNTPLQALTLLNNESFVEASQALAKRLLQEEIDDDRSRLGLAIRTCLTRPAEDEELDRMQNLLDHAKQFYGEQPEEAEAMVGEHAIPGRSNAEIAAWIATVRVLFNLDEFITRE
jgi:mono/diheme cytochrome c family protein